MMAPLPTSSHTDDRPELPRVRLDVRSASGRVVSYEVGAEDFLIGGSSGCDLRLPTPNLPPVLCQVSRKLDGIRVRRVTPVLPVLLNDQPLPANATTTVASGDVLTIADIQITVVAANLPSIIVPQFVSLEPESLATHSNSQLGFDASESSLSLEDRHRQLESPDVVRSEEWKRRDAELIRCARDLDRQTEELESDRVLWYQRRQEIEQELERRRRDTGLEGLHKADLDARDRELARVRDELSVLRERLLREYQERREELTRQQDSIREGNARMAADRQSLDSELNRRWTTLQADVDAQRKRLEAEILDRRELVEEELRQRKTAFEAELAARAARAETEALNRYRQQFEELERLRATTHDAIASARIESEELHRQAETEDARRRGNCRADW